MRQLTCTPTTNVVCVLDEHDRVVYSKRLPNDATATIAALRSCAGAGGCGRGVRRQLVSVGRWFADDGMSVHLVNPAPSRNGVGG